MNELASSSEPELQRFLEKIGKSRTFYVEFYTGRRNLADFGFTPTTKEVAHSLPPPRPFKCSLD